VSTGPAGVTNRLLPAFEEQEKSFSATAPSSLCPHCHSTKPLHPQIDKSEAEEKGNSSSAIDSNNKNDDDDYNNNQVGDSDGGLQLAKRRQLSSPNDGPFLK
jgi:hypothetical protein